MVLELAGAGYPILVGGDEMAPRVGRYVAERDVLVVTDENVAVHYLRDVCKHLGAAARLRQLILPAGEEHKAAAAFHRVLDVLVDNAFHRDAVVVALGGGVISDLAGFAAACYQRGIDWIAVPTTLLAQVDAAIGGKTAINHPRGKNLIGAFHDPLVVWANPATLGTLPEREYCAGLSEVVKYGLGLDAEFLGALEADAEALLRREAVAVTRAVERCARLKLQIVVADRTERGRRALLNLGHTVGHALETATGHGAWLHGEAVSVGLVAAAELSAGRGLLAAEAVTRLRDLLRALGLPVSLPPKVSEQALREALALDKKILGGKLRFIGLRDLGCAEIWNDVAESELFRAIRAVRKVDTQG